MIAHLLLPFIANFAIFVFVVNCGGKKKATPSAAGGPPGEAGDSKKQAPSKVDKPSDKKEGDDGNYEELAVPS